MSNVKTKTGGFFGRDLTSILTLLALVILMAGGYMVACKKARLREATSLPFYKIEMSEIADGEYTNQTYTTFLHLQLKVIVENHKIKDIEVLESEGIDSETARPILQEMIAQNSAVVPAIKKAELGSLVYISCVSSALHESGQAGQ